MKKIFSLLLITSIVFSACNSKSADAKAEKDSYEQTKETLEEKEKKNPLMFLTISSHDKRNLLGRRVVKATITNNAKVCTYKDVEIEISFFSKTGAVLEKDLDKVYDIINPGKSADYKAKYDNPTGTDSVAVKILSAKTK